MKGMQSYVIPISAMQKEISVFNFCFMVLYNPVVLHTACETKCCKILRVQITEDSGS